ncbi:hypothetical protein [Stutzerimonas stutzeri]|uniref:hypothetical protein n=1 Tax=Stutzerimonas stutzeri TaxID=316 RepID=UPI00177EF5A8|nr:hypothetical protein [Stutzerimonas stutzeri]MBD9408474.1 hypothetical protein [Stutzerimonas stutzeri]
MEKIYRLLAWLDMDQAVDWLQGLTATPLYPYDLLSLCASRRCSAYIDAEGLLGSDDGHEVVGNGIHKVLNPMVLAHVGTTAVAELALEGPVSLTEGEEGEEGEEESFWAVWHSKKTSLRECKPLFVPAEIEALARMINGQPDQPNENELEYLRKQLEQERAAREASEAELMRRRAEDGKRALENMRQMLMHEHSEFAAMQERAEQAERMVAVLEAQIAEQAEQRKSDESAFKALTRQVRELHGGNRPAPASQTGLVFPYATKELEAMRAAVAEYWEGYTPDKRQPTQKAIAYSLGEKLNLPRQGSGDPARKATALASAIKPDTLPDA